MMLHKIHRPIRFSLLLLLVALLSIACQNPVVETPTATEPTTSTTDCRIVEHEMGETEVCGQPQRVAALSPHILDSMLALGVQPAAYAGWVEYKDLKTQTYDNPAEQIPYLGRWVTTKPTVIGHRDSPSLERLTVLQPELILGEHWQSDKYALFTQIAPTLLFSDDKNPNEPQSWQQDIEGIAEALGREAQAEELLAAWKRQIAQARTALQPVLQAYPRIFLISTDLTTYINSQPESTTARLLKEIGFEVVKPGGTQGETGISTETLSKIDADIIIVMSRSDENFYNPEPVLRQKWEENPLLNSMSVFQQGRVFFVDIYLWSSVTRGPITDQLILEKLPQMLLPLVNEDN